MAQVTTIRTEIASIPAVRRATAARSVTVLGATGSIGASTIDLLKRNNGRFRVEAVSANRNATALARLAIEIGARFAAVADNNAYRELKEALAGSGVEAGAGENAIIEAAQRPSDLVVAAICGSIGLKPALAAVERGASIALANKECLVCAGAPFMRAAAAANAAVLPVDSEHNAVFQALRAGRREDLRRVILTASGGPFRTWSSEEIRTSTPAQALRHPNWSMGAKITIDSATLMNKGLELIEAYHLFSLRPDQLDVLVHPQSIVHGMVEFCDGSIVAQLGTPDMRTPIAHCLAWPERIESPAPLLELSQIANLTFEEPDLDRFPALALARRTLEDGGAAPTILNAANEVAVAAFIAGRLSFPGIAALVETTLSEAQRQGIDKELRSVEDALAIDRLAKTMAQRALGKIAAQ